MPFDTIKEAKQDQFLTKIDDVQLTIGQINHLARIYDALVEEGDVDNPMATAINQWKELYRKEGQKWVKIDNKEKSMSKKKKQKTKSTELMAFPFKFQDAPVQDKMEINVIPTGEWEHDAYGDISIDQEDLDKFVENFNKDIRNDVPITEGHAAEGEEKPAVGWFKKLINKGSEGLWAVVEWTEKGKELLENKSYKYFSPEFYRLYEDPETHEEFENVLVGGALTNSPYFKGLNPIVASESRYFNQLNLSNNNNMDIQKITKKDVSDLTDDEKEYLQNHSEELSDDQKEKFEEVLSDEEEEEEEDGDEDGDEEGEEEGDGDGEGVEGSEKDDYKKIPASEYKHLQKKANQGAKAMNMLNEKEIEEDVEKFTFSEGNEDGVILPKQKDDVVEFMKGLDSDQRNDFKEILKSFPTAKLFSEAGDMGIEASEDNVEKRVEKKVKEKMNEEDGLAYTDALKKVFKENPELKKEYNKEYGVNK